MLAGVTRTRTFSSSKWHPIVGYCRAIRVDRQVIVSGTTSINDAGEVHASGDMYGQSKRCLEIVEQALGKLDAKMSDVVRTRVYLTDVSRWPEAARAHREFFEHHPPACTMVAVSALIDPALLVEIEVDAVTEA